MLIEDLGNTIRERRTRLGFTQNDLAASLQVSPQAVSKWERGENAPDLALLPGLCELLAISVDALLGASWRDKRTFEATVMFADMVDFVGRSAGKVPEGVAVMLNTYYYTLTEYVLRHDGVPIKCIGDSLLCFFAGESHRERALRAAFEAKSASSESIHFGIATGPIWLGPIGHPSYARPDVIGETVNHAAIVEGKVAPQSSSGIAATESTVIGLGSVQLGTRHELDIRGTSLVTYEVVSPACQ